MTIIITNIYLPTAADGSNWTHYPTPYAGTNKSVSLNVSANGLYLYPNNSDPLPKDAYHSMNGMDWKPAQWHGQANTSREHRGLFFTKDDISADNIRWSKKPNRFKTIDYPWISQDTGRIYIGSNKRSQGWEENNLFGILWPTNQKWMYLPDWGWIHPGELNNGWAISYSADHGWLAFHASVMAKAYSINE